MLGEITDRSTRLRYESLSYELQEISPLLEDSRVNEILLNADGRVWVDRAGAGLSLTKITMAPHQAETVLKTIAAIMGSELGSTVPSLQGHLEGGIRVQGLLPPVVEQPIFALRKPSPVVFTLEQLSEQGVLPPALANDFSAHGSSFAVRWRKALEDAEGSLGLLDKVRLAIALRANFLIGGPTSSGKTSIGKAIYEYLARQTPPERLLVIQDTVEIPSLAPNEVSIRAAEGWVFTPRQAVLAAMRLRPDRIIVGEIREGHATLELLKGWGTGHPGGYATIHGDHAPGLLDRFAQLIEEVVYPAPRRLIAEAVNVLLYIERDAERPAGRSITAAAVVEGVEPDGRWQLSPL